MGLAFMNGHLGTFSNSMSSDYTFSGQVCANVYVSTPMNTFVRGANTDR